MNRMLKKLTAFAFVSLFATTIIMSCGQKAAETDQSAETKDSTEHPAGEHPNDSTEHPAGEHPSDSTKN